MKSKRSSCPVSCSLEMIGDKWTLLIIRDLFCGKSQFRDFLNSPEKIATNILSDRLQRLVSFGIIKKKQSRAYSAREEYLLTKKGKTLWPVLEAVADWGLTNIPGTEMRLNPKQE